MLTSATFWIAFIFTLVFFGFFAMLFPETNKGRVVMMVVCLVISFGIGNLACMNEKAEMKDGITEHTKIVVAHIS